MTTPYVVLVCGGRYYQDRARVWAVLSALEPFPTLIVHGGAAGADTEASRWAAWAGVPAQTYFAQWAQFGPSAGPRRNEQMLREAKPDHVVAFPGGRGTAHMVEIARAAGVCVTQIPPRPRK